MILGESYRKPELLKAVLGDDPFSLANIKPAGTKSLKRPFKKGPLKGPLKNL